MAAVARCQNNGQSCIAAKRFIVHEAVADAFTERFVRAMEAQQVGDPMRDDTDVGPLIDHDALEKVSSWVDEAVQSGAEILVGALALAIAATATAAPLGSVWGTAQKIDEIDGKLRSLQQIRAALMRLEQEGLIESLPNGGYAVEPLSEPFDAGTFDGPAVCDPAPGDATRTSSPSRAPVEGPPLTTVSSTVIDAPARPTATRASCSRSC